MKEIEQLMQPRYKVIADYPGSILKVGSVLCYDETNPLSKKGFCKIYDQFPVIFKKLEWWEERHEDEMPKYVKALNDGSSIDYVLKVEKYIKHKEVDRIWAFEYYWEHEPDIKRMSLNGWIPATEADYQSHLTQH